MPKLHVSRAALAVVATCALLSPGTASAEDVTFHIPVEMTDVHSDVDQFRVQCYLFAGPLTIGSGQTDTVITGSAFMKTVDVVVTNSYATESSHADGSQQPTNYSCQLFLHNGPLDNWGSVIGPGNSSPTDWRRETRRGNITLPGWRQYSYVASELP